MCVAVIGGMDRLERHYKEEAEKRGIDLRVFTKSAADMASRIRNVDAVVIFTNKTSHQIKKEAMDVANARNIPVLMYHSCGVCTLRDCLSCIEKQKGGVRGA
ncbi:MAG: DUF2325 domain-containing protein [Nitrospirota bacterium]